MIAWLAKQIFFPSTCKQFSTSITGKLTEYRVKIRYSMICWLAFSHVVTVPKFSDAKKSVNRLKFVEISREYPESVDVLIIYFVLLTGRRNACHFLDLWSTASHRPSQELTDREYNQIWMIIQCLIFYVHSGHSGAVLCDVMSGYNIPIAFYLVDHDTWGIMDYFSFQGPADLHFRLI